MSVVQTPEATPANFGEEPTGVPAAEYRSSMHQDDFAPFVFESDFAGEQLPSKDEIRNADHTTNNATSHSCSCWLLRRLVQRSAVYGTGTTFFEGDTMDELVCLNTMHAPGSPSQAFALGVSMDDDRHSDASDGDDELLREAAEMAAQLHAQGLAPLPTITANETEEDDDDGETSDDEPAHKPRLVIRVSQVGMPGAPPVDDDDDDDSDLPPPPPLPSEFAAETFLGLHDDSTTDPVVLPIVVCIEAVWLRNGASESTCADGAAARKPARFG